MPKRIVTAERDEVDAFAHVGHEREMIGPGAIDVVQGAGAFRVEDGVLPAASTSAARASGDRCQTSGLSRPERTACRQSMTRRR